MDCRKGRIIVDVKKLEEATSNRQIITVNYTCVKRLTFN